MTEIYNHQGNIKS